MSSRRNNANVEVTGRVGARSPVRGAEEAMSGAAMGRARSNSLGARSDASDRSTASAIRDRALRVAPTEPSVASTRGMVASPLGSAVAGTDRANPRKTKEHTIVSRIFGNIPVKATLYEGEIPEWYLYLAAKKVAERGGVHSRVIQEVADHVISDLAKGRKVVALNEQGAMEEVKDVFGEREFEEMRKAFISWLTDDIAQPTAHIGKAPRDPKNGGPKTSYTYMLTGLSRHPVMNSSGKQIGYQFSFTGGQKFQDSEQDKMKEALFGAVLAKKFQNPRSLDNFSRAVVLTRDFAEAVRGDFPAVFKEKNIDDKSRPKDQNGKWPQIKVPDIAEQKKQDAYDVFLKNIQQIVLTPSSIGKFLPFGALVALYSRLHPDEARPGKKGQVGFVPVTVTINKLLGFSAKAVLNQQGQPVVGADGKPLTEGPLRQVVNGQEVPPTRASGSDLGSWLYWYAIA